MSAIRNKLSEGVIGIEKARRVKLDILDDLEELEKKPYGWSGSVSGSLPIRHDVAREIRERLLGTYGMDLRSLPRADVLMMDDGTVRIRFTVKKRRLMIDVLCHAVVNVLANNGDTYSLDAKLRLAKGAPATGYTCEIDAWTDWLLEDEPTE